MPLTMRATGLSSSPVDKDYQDWTIFDDGEPVGRIYEDASASTPAELRWFWSVTDYVNPKSGIVAASRSCGQF
jgi:hypothetical protein